MFADDYIYLYLFVYIIFICRMAYVDIGVKADLKRILINKKKSALLTMYEMEKEM